MCRNKVTGERRYGRKWAKVRTGICTWDDMIGLDFGRAEGGFLEK